MSSDSDDLDEDELLQMALKEQQHRDVNYLTNSRKPVANYVQPPSQTRKSASAAAVSSKNSGSNAQPKGGRRVVDDDDDSEVEMLSISSGDEDSTKDHRTSAAGGPGGRASRSSGRDDDPGWDGEEPHCWKHVDEDEVLLYSHFDFASVFLSYMALSSSFRCFRIVVKVCLSCCCRNHLRSIFKWIALFDLDLI